MKHTDLLSTADHFLRTTNTRIKIQFLYNGVYGLFGDDKYRDVYSVTISRGRKRYKTLFGQSVAMSGIEAPSAYDILATLEKYDVGSFDDFCNEYDYNAFPLSEYPRIYKVWEECTKQYEALADIYNENEMNVLREIQ